MSYSHTLAAFFVTLAASTAAAADYRTPRPEPASVETVSYEVRVLSVATSLHCDASHSFRQTLTVCSSQGCTSLDITEQPSFTFAAPAGGRIALATSTSYARAGVVYGDSEVDQLRTGGHARIVQTVIGHSSCMKSVAYELAPVAK